MSELNFERSIDDWDLQAIVKGQAKVSNNIIMEMPPSYAWLEDYYQNQENATMLLNELHQICNPNYHNISDISSSAKILDDAMIVASIDDDKFAEFPLDEPKEKIEDVPYAKSLALAPKRRKGKYKKTSVQQARSDRIASDKWNWRKYGEKVIKGSPYPRSYYRCSNNSGECLARKQVEQSCIERGQFLITYINDHSHPYPSHRPSQAGRTSRRFHALPKHVISSIGSVDTSSATTTQATSSPSIANDDEFFAGLEGLEMDLLYEMGSYCD